MPTQSKLRNRLLRSLTPEDFSLLEPHFEPVSFPIRKTLYLPNEAIRWVYFPESGVVSVVSLFDSGQMIEVGVIGREGMVGLPILFGADASFTECFIQSPGSGWRLDAAILREAIKERPSLHAALLGEALAFLIQVAQTAACNGLHTLPERLARWLLMVHDRGDGDQILLTQEAIAAMLGVRRAGVTVAAGNLQKAGLIAYGKGSITIIDRAGLEAASCPCYAIVKDQIGKFRH